MNKEEFNEKISNFKTKYDLLLILLNTLLLIENNRYYYCFCQNKNKCLICRIPNVSYYFENDLKDNMFNEEYLKNYHLKLIQSINKLFFQNKASACCFLDDEYTYRSRDWYSGET